MKYRILEPGTTISGFADSLKKYLMPTDPRFLAHLAKDNVSFCHHLASVVCRR
jgi:hypothetical protein